MDEDELYYKYGADEEYDPYYDSDDQYTYFDGYEQEEYVGISFHELISSCIWPTFSQTIWMVFPLLILCLVQRLTWSLFWQGKLLMTLFCNTLILDVETFCCFSH